MNDSHSSWFRLLPIGLFLLLLIGAAGASLTLINLRQDKARLAATAAKLRNDLTDTSRHLQEMTATVAAAIQPSMLRARVGTRLVPMSDKQIVWVRPGSSVPTFAARPTAPTPVFASVESAFTPIKLQ